MSVSQPNFAYMISSSVGDTLRRLDVSNRRDRHGAKRRSPGVRVSLTGAGCAAGAVGMQRSPPRHAGA